LIYRDPLFFRLGAVHFFSLSVIGFFWSHSGAVAESRRSPAKHIETAGQSGAGFCWGLHSLFGWTPCIGPILATVLALAAASETIFAAFYCSRRIRRALRFLFAYRGRIGSFSSFISASESICTPSNSLAARFCYLSAR